MRSTCLKSVPIHVLRFRKSCLFVLLLVSGCKTTTYFTSSNELHKEKVILYLKDQSKVPGTMTLSLEYFYNVDVDSKTSIQFIREGDSTEQNIDLKEVTGYSFGSDFYALKKLDLF